MAGFCNRCGRPLQDGEVCTCTQQGNQGMAPQGMPNQGQFQQGMPNQGQFQQGMPNQGQFQQNMGQMAPNYNQQYQGYPGGGSGGMIMKDLGSSFVGMFKDPVGTIQSVAAKNRLSGPMAMVITHIIVVLLMSTLSLLIFSNTTYGKYLSRADFPYVLVVIGFVMVAAGYDFAQGGAMLLCNKVFFHENTTFAGMLSVVRGRAIMKSVVTVVVALLGAFNFRLGLIIYAAGTLFTTMIYFMGYQKVSSLSDTKKTYSVYIANIFVTIAIWLLIFLLGSAVVSASDLKEFDDLLGIYTALFFD